MNSITDTTSRIILDDAALFDLIQTEGIGNIWPRFAETPGNPPPGESYPVRATQPYYQNNQAFINRPYDERGTVKFINKKGEEQAKTLQVVPKENFIIIDFDKPRDANGNKLSFPAGLEDFLDTHPAFSNTLGWYSKSGGRHYVFEYPRLSISENYQQIFCFKFTDALFTGYELIDYPWNGALPATPGAWHMITICKPFKLQSLDELNLIFTGNKTKSAANGAGQLGDGEYKNTTEYDAVFEQIATRYNWAATKPGTRNNAVFSFAAKFIEDRRIPREFLACYCLKANERFNNPPEEEDEVVRALNSALCKVTPEETLPAIISESTGDTSTVNTLQGWTYNLIEDNFISPTGAAYSQKQFSNKFIDLPGIPAYSNAAEFVLKKKLIPVIDNHELKIDEAEPLILFTNEKYTAEAEIKTYFAGQNWAALNAAGLTIIRPGLITIGAEASMGKTSFLTHLAGDLLMHNEKMSFLFYTLDDSGQLIYEKMSKQFTSKNFFNRVNVMADIKLHSIENAAQRLMRETQTEQIIIGIDYLQILNTGADVRTGLNDTVKKIKNIQKNLNCIFFLCAQLSRSREGTFNYRETSEIENVSDVCLNLNGILIENPDKLAAKKDKVITDLSNMNRTIEILKNKTGRRGDRFNTRLTENLTFTKLHKTDAAGGERLEKIGDLSGGIAL